MNKRLLHSVIVKNGDTYSDLSKYLGISASTLSRKLNNKEETSFYLNEMIKIKNKYSLTAADMDEIFFTKEVS